MERAATTGRNRVLPWSATALGVGVLLGLVAVVLPTLPPLWLPVAVLAVVLPFVLMMVADLERALLAVILFDTVIPLDTYLGYREDAAQLAALGGLPLSLTTLLLALLYGSWALRSLARREPGDPGLMRAAAPLTAYVLVVAVSYLGAADPQLASFEIGLVAQLLLLFVYVVHAVRTRGDLWFLTQVLVAVLLAQSAIMAGLVAYGRSVEVGPFLARIDVETGGRVGGTIGSPNAAGAVLTLLLLPTLAVWRAARDGATRHVAGFAFLFGTTMLVFTLSRGAWLGFGVAMMVFLFVGRGRDWLSRRLVAGLAVLASVGLAVFSGVIAERLFGPGASTPQDRLGLIRVALGMIQDNPLTGVGANGFAAALGEYRTPRAPLSFVSIVHNKYLLVASETGLLGLLAFLAFLGATLRRGWWALRRSVRGAGLPVLGLWAAFVGVMVHMLFDLFHGRTDTQMLIIVAALLTAAWRIARREDAAASEA